MRAATVTFIVLGFTAGCVHARPCKCICACHTAKAPAVANACVGPKAFAEDPVAQVPPAYLRQVAGAVQRLEERHTFEDELALQEAQQIAEGLAHPEEAAREGKAVTDIAELERKLAGLVRP